MDTDHTILGGSKAAMLLAGLTVISGLSNGTSLTHRITKAVLLLIHTYIPIHTYILVKLYVLPCRPFRNDDEDNHILRIVN